MKRAIFFIAVVLVSWSCSKEKTAIIIDVQGYRGCRGLMPENTLPAMIKAVELGVNTITLDVAVSKDKLVLLSCEPFLSHDICLTEQGNEISEDDERIFNLQKMDYEEIRKCDCGSLPLKKFPEQKKMVAYKPLLSEVIDSVEKYISDRSLPVICYNIQINSSPETDGTFHPRIAEFTERVMDVIKEKNISDKVIIQSSDYRVLQAIHKKYAEIKVSLLVENRLGPEKNIEKLGFVPDIYSPQHLFVNEDLMRYSKENNFTVIPWTVNEKEEILSVLKQGVHGIITDYPDRARLVVSDFLAGKK